MRRFPLMLAFAILTALSGCIDLLPKRQPYQRPDGVVPMGVHLQQGQSDPTAGLRTMPVPGHQPDMSKPGGMRQFMPQEVDNRSADELLSEDP